MARVRFPRLHHIASKLAAIGRRGSRRSDHLTAKKRFRSLQVDPLEERTLLTVTHLDWQDGLVNETIDYQQQFTIAGQSVASDNDGDFVVVWQRDDGVFDENGDPILDPDTGLPLDDWNIYARYFTPELQRVTLPNDVLGVDSDHVAKFTLNYGGNEVQKINIRAPYRPFLGGQPVISGLFTLSFDGNTSDPFFFDETEELATNAELFRSVLAGLDPRLADVEVEGITPHEYIVRFGDASGGQDMPEISGNLVTGITGFYPGILVETVRQPVVIPDILVSTVNMWDTAHAIEDAFAKFTTPDEMPYEYGFPNGFPYGPLVGPVATPPIVRLPVPRVRVFPISTTQFNITFTGETFDPAKTGEALPINHPELVIGGIAVVEKADVAAPGVPILAEGEVRTMKESSDEFRVNEIEPDDPLTGVPRRYAQTLPAVAMDADGDFVITWQGEVPDAVDFGSVSDVFARRFKPVATVPDGEEEFVYTYVNGLVDPTDPDQFVHRIRGVVPYGSEFRVNTFSTNAQGEPHVGMDDDGNFVIAWSGLGQPISFFNQIYAQRFNRDGDRIGGQWTVSADSSTDPPTEDTEIHRDPYVGMSRDGHFAIAWTMPQFVTVMAELYDPAGNEVIPQFVVNTGASPTVAFDRANNYIVAWEVVADSDSIGTTSLGVYSQMYQINRDAQGVITGQTIIRDPFRVNSASFNPGSVTEWPLGQGGHQIVTDADGDLTGVYAGYGPDMSYAGAIPPSYFLDLIETGLGGKNSDLLAFFPFRILPFDGMQIGDVDSLIDEVLFNAVVAGATPDQMGRLGVVLERVAGLLRGEANGIMYSQWDADPQLGVENILASDNVANAFRDGHNERYILWLDEDINGGSFTLRVITPGGLEDVTMTPVFDAAGNLLEGLSAIAFDNQLTAAGVTGDSNPVSVRVVFPDERALRDDFAWDIDNPLWWPGDPISPDDHVWEIVFQGDIHDEFISLFEVAPNNLTVPPVPEIQTVFIQTGAPGGSGYFRIRVGTEDGEENLFWFGPNPGPSLAVQIQNEINSILGSNDVVVNLVGVVDDPVTGFVVSVELEVLFVGDQAGINIGPVGFMAAEDLEDGQFPFNGTLFSVEEQRGATPVAPFPITVEEALGDEGTTQFGAGIGMQPDGDYVIAWTQFDEFTSFGASNANIYFRRFDEHTDTAGPIATDFLLDTGERLANGGQVTHPLEYIVVTFDEEMVTDDEDPLASVTNVNNWSLLRNGTEVFGGIDEIFFGMNMASTLAEEFGLPLDPVGTNKWEAVLVLDGNGITQNVEPLSNGHYEIVALNSMTDRAGNPLERTGFLVNGQLFRREFDVITPTGSETSVSDDADGDQMTHPGATTPVASDGDGDYVAVWTTDRLDGTSGVYARLYSTVWSEVNGDRVSNVVPVGDAFLVSALVPDVAGLPAVTEASVAMDADGDFVVTWAQQMGGLRDWDIMAQRFDALGNPLTEEPFRVNSETNDIQRSPAVAMDADGDFMIVWQSQDQDGDGYGVYAQRYSPAGAALGGTNEIQILSFLDNPQGTFTLFWDGDGDPGTQNVTGTISYAGNTFNVSPLIETQLTNLVEASGLGETVGVEVSALNQTQVVVRFTGEAINHPQILVQDASLTGGAGARIETSTRVDGASGEFLVNDTTANNQMFPSVAASQQGEFVVSWTSFGQDGDAPWESNVYAKQLFPNDVLRGTTIGRTTESKQAATIPEWVDKAHWYPGLGTAPKVTTTDDPGNHVVTPGQGYEGVVQLSLDGVGRGNGALLSSGIHVLTVAHLVTDLAGNLLPGDFSVTFGMASGDVTIGVSEIFVHPNWDGNAFTGDDVAVLVLEQPAPDLAERYDIYRALDDGDLNRVVDIVGYGATGTGDRGEDFSFGTKRLGQNVYEMTSDLVYGGPATVVVYDFDSGSPLNDSIGIEAAAAGFPGFFDTGLGDDEASSAVGDSGAPAFLEGTGTIVALTSFGLAGLPGIDVVPGNNASFGDIAFDTRVAAYATFIDTVILGAAAEFLVNQTIELDQKWSSVAVDADGDFVITWTAYGQDGVGTGYGLGADGREGIFARRYNSDGSDVEVPDPGTGQLVPLGEFQVNTFADNEQQYSRVAMDANGDFVVAWESFQDRPIPQSPQPDDANSFGIFAQRYARNDALGQVFLGPNGEIGGEFQVHSTTDGDQRFPGVSMDHTGDAVIVWSGPGEQLVPLVVDDQGIWSQAYDKPVDDAGPIVADVFDAVADNGSIALFQVLDGTSFGDVEVERFLVTFSEEMNTESGASGIHSVTNRRNWTLSRNGAQVFGAVASVEWIDKTESESGKHEAWVTFDADPTVAGNQPLGAGAYVLTISDMVWDVFDNPLDGDMDGEPGNDFELAFTIAVGVSIPDLPNDPTVPPGEDEDDLPVNQMTFGFQTGPAVAADAEGNYVVVYVSDYYDMGDIVAQRFNRFGVPQGGEFTVNSYLDGWQTEPDVAMDPFGNFVVTWSGEGEDDASGVFARRFDNFGKPQGEQFRVNTFKPFDQNRPEVAIDGNGDFVITWTSYGQDGDKNGVFAQRYNFGGAPMGTEFQVNQTWANRQKDSDVATDAAGNFVIVWVSEQATGQFYDVYARLYNAAGAALTGEFRVNQYTTDDQLAPGVAMDAVGNFVVAWQSWRQVAPSGGSQSEWDIFARRYSSGGAASTGEFLVNQHTPLFQYQPSIDMADNGDFIISWTTYGQDNENARDYGIFARLFHGDLSPFVFDGQALGEFPVNIFTEGDQQHSAAAIAGDSSTAVVVWEDQDFDFILTDPTDPTTAQLIFSLGIYARLFGIGSASKDTTVPPPVTDLVLKGTSGADTFEFVAAANPGSWIVKVNGVAQTVPAGATSVTFDGLGGEDTVLLTGLNGADDTANVFPKSATMTGPGYKVTVANVEAITLQGGTGKDVLVFEDSPGDDTLAVTVSVTNMFGPGYFHQAKGFETVHGYARNTGPDHDTAWLWDTPGDDQFVATPEYGRMIGDGYFARAKFFEVVNGMVKNGGYDVAQLNDGPGDDTFTAWPTWAELDGPDYYIKTKNFDVVRAFASTGNDIASLYDSPGNDNFYATAIGASLYGSGFWNSAYYFPYIHGYSNSTGTDVAQLFDSAGDDRFVAKKEFTYMQGDGFFVRAKHFEYIHGYASSGMDQAWLSGTGGSDQFYADGEIAWVMGGGVFNRAKFFEKVSLIGNGGVDSAYLHDAVLTEGVQALEDNPAYAKVVWLYGLETLYVYDSPGLGDYSLTNNLDKYFSTFWP